MDQTILFGLLIVATHALMSNTELCSPDQWEGRQEDKEDLGEGVGFMRSESLYFYDAKNLRKAYISNVSFAGSQTHSYTVVRYEGEMNNRTQYTVDLATAKCSILRSKQPFEKHCIPSFATHLGDYYLGLREKGGLKVSNYQITTGDVSVAATVTMISSDVMVPVIMSYFEDVTGSSLEEIVYSDITLGIKNLHIFDIPKPCLMVCVHGQG